jgi:rhodanese-related sulfurtransferase
MQHSEGFLKIVNDAKSRIREISPEETREHLETGRPLHFIDVREDHEWNQGHAIEALVPDPSAEIILYCGGGYRSALAADALQKMGYTQVFSMSGGYKGWVNSGLPTVRD